MGKIIKSKKKLSILVHYNLFLDHIIYLSYLLFVIFFFQLFIFILFTYFIFKYV